MKVEASSKAAAHEAVAGAEKKKHAKGDIWCSLFLIMLDAMNAHQEVAATGSKVLALNAAMQQKDNKALADIPHSQIPQGAQQATIDAAMQNNEFYAAQRQRIQDELVTERQSGNIQMTTENTYVNDISTDGADGSAYLKALLAVSTGLSQMSNPTS